MEGQELMMDTSEQMKTKARMYVDEEQGGRSGSPEREQGGRGRSKRSGVDEAEFRTGKFPVIVH